MKKGGAVEFIEWDLFFRANEGNGDRLAALRQWTESYLNAIGRSQGDGRKSRQSPPNIHTILESSGFVNVSADTLEIPLGPWSTSQSNSSISIEVKLLMGLQLKNNVRLVEGPKPSSGVCCRR